MSPPSIPSEEEAACESVEDARKSVEDAASVSGTLWLSYLFTLFYIGLAAGGVTHKDLLLESPVKLPFLNVELPLVWFFALAPILFVLVHAYALTHFVMLAGKIGAFNAAVGPDGNAIRRRLPSNIFAQFLAGPDDIRTGGLGWLLKTIAWITLVVAPVLLLLFLQAQFLPYHSEGVTWFQRGAVLADVLMIWALWPAVIGGRSELQRPRPWRHWRMTAFSLAALAIAFAVATFPGERLDTLPPARWIPLTVARTLSTDELIKRLKEDRRKNTRLVKSEEGWTELSVAWRSAHDLAFAGEVDPISRQPRSPFYASLVLIGFDALEAAKIDGDDKLKWAKRTLVARGRNLHGAVFDFADLRKSDFTGANLEAASFSEAKLQDSYLDRARLKRAQFSQAQMERISLEFAQLQDASLELAQLQEAKLYGAQLQGASFGLALMQGADLEHTNLQGAQLTNAQLQGASFNEARLQGATLRSARLQWVSLVRAQMQGASLDQADLRGASLFETQLQGASLFETQLQGATMDGTAIWRTDPRHARGAHEAWIVNLNHNKSFGCFKWTGRPPRCTITDGSLKDIERALDTIPNGDAKQAAIDRVDKALKAETYPDSDIEENWNKLSSGTRPLSHIYVDWSKMGCTPAQAPYAARALLRRFDNSSVIDEAGWKILAKAFLDKRCAKMIGLSTDEINDMKRLAKIDKTARR